MNKPGSFCTCDRQDCPLHPLRHEQGCTLCIKKNLNRREIPNCFFRLVENSEARSGDTFEDFARLIMEALAHETKV